MEDLKRSSYKFDLPTELIAQRPTAQREACDLMVYQTHRQKIEHVKFSQIAEFLPEKSCLVFNNSKVIPCRIFGKKPTGGSVEIFVIEPLAGPERVKCFVRCSGKKHLGSKYQLPQGVVATIIERSEEVFYLNFNVPNLIHYLEQYALMPIPPYIRDGISDEKDKTDYQNVYSSKLGSVAAPTAGLHFSEKMIEQLKEQGHTVVELTLHVGIGTFAPIKVEDIKEHSMHQECFEIEQKVYQKLLQEESIIAVGTTSLRVLEFLKRNQEQIKFNQQGVYRGQTDIFIYPGQKVGSITGLITNFHLPESSLLMLVSALTGREKLLELYREAITKNYRFYSYGDAMFINMKKRNS